MAGIMHFSNYFRYMESAEHEFFRSLGMSVHSDAEARGWARVDVHCTYRRPLRYQDLVQLHVIVQSIGERSMEFVVMFDKVVTVAAGAAEATETVARGTMTTVCVTRGADGALRSVSVPPEVTARIEAAPVDQLRELVV